MDNNLAGQTVDFPAASLTLELIDIDSGSSLRTFTSLSYTADCSFSFTFGKTRMINPGSYMYSLPKYSINRFQPKDLVCGWEGSKQHSPYSRIRSVSRYGPSHIYRLKKVTEAVYRAPFQCFNGGTDNGDGTCTCPKKFNNSSDCSVPNCGSYPVNQFPGNGRGLCICPQGTAGDFCDEGMSLTCTCLPYFISSSLL